MIITGCINATPEELYHEYIRLGERLFEALKPTPEEIKDINEEIIDIGVEDLLCEPTDPQSGGDIGLLACLVYERREAVKEEETDSHTGEGR